ncbi:MAG: HisA/HisF-related TIM barrel protein, partial [Betaproteobacteria bacterium]
NDGTPILVTNAGKMTLQPDGSYQAYTDCGREKTGVDVFEWAVRAAELGAGEIVITSVDREGTGKGFDLELTRRVAESVSIPVIACGGAGGISHVREVIQDGKADAVCLASCLHYEFIQNHAQHDDCFASEGNTEFLRRQTTFSRIESVPLPTIKQALDSHHIDCRWN